MVWAGCNGKKRDVSVRNLCGVMIEGNTSQHGGPPNDIGVTEQVRVVRRLVVQPMATLSRYAERTL